MKKINRIHKMIILSFSALFVLPGCEKTDVLNTEDNIDEIIAIGGPVKYDSDGNPLYNEYGSQFEQEWKSKDGNIKFILDNLLGIEGRGRYQGSYIYKEKSYKSEVCMEPDCLGISAEEIAYDDNDDPFLLQGTYTKNDENNEFTLTVEKISGNIKTKTNDIISLIYNVGDEIIFYKVSN